MSDDLSWQFWAVLFSVCMYGAGFGYSLWKNDERNAENARIAKECRQ